MPRDLLDYAAQERQREIECEYEDELSRGVAPIVAQANKLRRLVALLKAVEAVPS